jgi:heme oxygenase
VTEASGVVARLSSETQLQHRDADGELEMLLSEPTTYAYRTWLSRQLAFHRPLEAALEATAGLAGIVGIRPRSKVARLRTDLLALGIEHELLAKLTPCADVPATFANVGTALGWMYVAERSTLQFHNAYRQLARALPGEIAFASSYLKCYEGTAGVMWRAFVAAVDATCRAPDENARLVAGAHAAFRAQRGPTAIARVSGVAAAAAQGARATRG